MNVLEKLAFYWNYPFVRYALIVGVLIALCSSLLGVTLVLKRFSFIGDGLSHVAFGGMAVATVLGMSDHMPLTLVRWRACNGLSADESVLDLGKPVRRCVQHLVRLYLDSDPDKIRGLALHRAVHRCSSGVCVVLQSDIRCHF